MTYQLPGDQVYGRGTFCGSGGGSDCPALRVLPDGRIGVSSSEDGGPQLSLDVDDPGGLARMLDAVAGGQTVALTSNGVRVAVVSPAVAQDGPAVELAFEGHEIDQLARGYLSGQGPADVRAAIGADTGRPEIASTR